MDRFVLVEESERRDFEHSINRLLGLGYELHGTPFQTDGPKHWMYAQALVLPLKKDGQCANCGYHNHQ